MLFFRLEVLYVEFEIHISPSSQLRKTSSAESSLPNELIQSYYDVLAAARLSSR
jgi:hypothetical protein